METKKIIEALAALAQETRLSIFRLLVQAGEEGIAAGKLAETLSAPSPTLSFHLQQLRHAGLINSTRKGTQIFYCASFGDDGEKCLNADYFGFLVVVVISVVCLSMVMKVSWGMMLIVVLLNFSLSRLR